MLYTYFFNKKADRPLSVERELQRYSLPNFTPFTITIKTLLQEIENETVPERSLLYELQKRIDSFLPVIDKVLRQALSEKNNKQLINLYSLLVRKIKEFRQIIIAKVLDQPFTPTIAFSELMHKFAQLLDVVKYNRAKTALQELLPVASEIDSSIRDLSIQLRNIQGHEGLGIPEESQYESFPSLDVEEEKKEKPQSADFPPEFSVFFNNIGTWNNERFEQFKEELSNRVPMYDQPLFEKNLTALRRLARTGSLKSNYSQRSGIERKNLSDRYLSIVNILEKYKEVINGANFEDVIVEYPEILKEILSEQYMLEQYGIIPERIKGAPVVETSRLTNDEGKVDPSTGGVFNQFNVPPELKSLLDKFGIEDDFGILQTGKEVNENFFKPIVLPELLNNPEKYVEPNDLRGKGGFGVNSLGPEEKSAYLMNRAAISYSLYQFHQMHALITSILKKLIPFMRATKGEENSLFIKEQIDNLKEILKIAFPPELVDKARQSVMKDDKALITKQIVGKQLAGSHTKELFGNMDVGNDWYDKMLETMMPQFFKKALKDAPESMASNLKSRTRKQQPEGDLLNLSGKEEKRKQKLYFVFSAVDRGGPVTRMLSYAYGGIYWFRTKDPDKGGYKGYEQVTALNPTYFSKRIIFKSILDYEQETFTANAPAKVADMATHIESVVETKPVDDKTAFYLAYGRSSLDNTIDTKIGWSQDLMSVLNEWVKNYKLRTQPKTQQPIQQESIPTQPEPLVASRGYNYLYPINWLFK